MSEPYKNQQFPWDSYPPKHPQTPEKGKTGWTGGKVIAVALICSLLGGLFGAGGMFFASQLLTYQPEPEVQENVSTLLEGMRENSVIATTQIDTGKLMTPAEVYAANVNSTVGITTSITTNYWGYQSTAAASGSGFIFSDDGYILTNHHVIEDSDSITVSLYDGRSFDAKLIGYDESNDIAVLKIEADGLVPVILGDSENLNVGDSVVAIGNPLGELTFSLTSGAISAKDREITMSNGSTMRLMQTDCAINSGNSGGALFNLYGEVVGITNAKYSSNSSTGASIDNIGFAIPINTARKIAESIIEKGYVAKPYIGVSVADVSAETQSYGLPQGAAVRVVNENSPAAAAGLKLNDIITHVNDKALTGSSDLVHLVTESAPGDVLNLTVYRQGSTLTLSITVGEKIQSALEESSSQSQSQSNIPQKPWGFQ